MKTKSIISLVTALIAAVVLALPASAATPNVATAVRGTPVTRLRALGTINLRTGPGTEFRRVGRVYSGDVLLVTGASDHYGWWRVRCPWGGTCWISASPFYTKPISWR